MAGAPADAPRLPDDETTGLTSGGIGRNLKIMPTLSFDATVPAARRIRAAARRRGIPVAQFIKEAAVREATQRDAGWRAEEPNETTAEAIREPVKGLPQFRTVDEALRSVKFDAKRRLKSQFRRDFGRWIEGTPAGQELREVMGRIAAGDPLNPFKIEQSKLMAVMVR